MLPWDSYELLDFGDGRKLERFGDYQLDRPCPAAEGQAIVAKSLWTNAIARFVRQGDGGQWNPPFGDDWRLDCGKFELALTPTPFGHVGVFPEQIDNWRWIDRQVTSRRGPLRVLNLFAYTGASSLAAAAAGAHVVHVDGAKNVVQWARRNAARSKLAEAPIRWIVEDVQKFVAREAKRANRYDGIILDPPSYGHGPKGETWKLNRDLLPTLQRCVRLLSDERAFIVVTCHSPGFGPAELGAYLRQVVFGHCQGHVDAKVMNLTTSDGRRLPAGVLARVRF